MLRATVTLALLVAVGVSAAPAHDGHDHGSAPTQPTRAVAPRAEASSDALELVLTARGSDLFLHLDRFRTNEPVAGAAVEIDGPSGTLKAAEVSAGVYSVSAPFLAKPGNYDLAVTVGLQGTVDLLAATLRIPAEAGAKQGASSVALRDIAQRFPDGSAFVSKASQQILALRTQFTEQKAHARSIELPGRVVADPNASGLVQASIGGRLYPPDGGFKPLGTRVKAGDVLAYVRPPLPLADATLQAQQARELEQQISILSRRVERYRSLAPSGAVARSQLEDAELELKGLKERLANLDRVKREPEALTAPVDGVIASANAVTGQMAEPNAVIFQIIEPTRLWVEALSFEPRGLTATAAARLADGRTLDLAYLGTGFSDRNQSVPVQFAVTGETGGVRPGQFVIVLAQMDGERAGVAIPRTSVLRGSNGQSIVYEHSAAERFVPREVRVEPLDGTHVLVVAGLGAGKRVVTQGAELLNQIR